MNSKQKLTEADLLPCPFCGSRAYVWRSNYATFVECIKYETNNHRVMFSASTDEEAYKLWNTRSKNV